MKNLKFKLTKLLLLLFLSINITISTNAFVEITANPTSITKEFDYSNWEYNVDLNLHYPIMHELYKQSPTLAYASVPQFKKHLLCDEYWDNLKDQIIYIGTEYIEPIINKVIKNTVKYSNDYVPFFHGQRREFRLLQDIYTKLYEIFNETKLDEFCFIRVPNKNFETFKKTEDFITKYELEILNNSYPDSVFDNNKEANQHILSVNPSLFSNTIYSLSRYISECTFKYFIRSDNITSIDILDFVEKMFDNFNINWIFLKHRSDIKYLIKLLQEDEIHKTGSLLQIFIPKNIVNQITYRSRQGGAPFYGIEKENHIPTTNILDQFPRSLLQLSENGFYDANTYFNTGSYQELDQLQFRILITKNIMLNPNSGVKIIRHTSLTPNMKIYKKELTILLKKIIKDIKKEGPGIIDKLFISIHKFFG